MGIRRDDIPGSQRAPIVIEALSPHRPHGTISRLAREHGVSRQTIYQMAAVGQARLTEALAPGRHGPHPPQTTISVDRNRLVRGSVVLTEVGVSQRDIPVCLEELLDTPVSPSWVNAQLAQLEAAAEKVNYSWRPAIGEGLSGDEIYSNGLPNLLVVGNESMYVYALTRQPDCGGDTWACVLLDGPDCPQFASDAGTGLAAGVKLAQVTPHQLDWDHLLRPVWGQVARLEDQAYAALEACQARAAQFEQAQTPKRLAHHLAAWERLTAEAQVKVERYDQFHQLATQIDAEFGLIDPQTGDVRDPQRGTENLGQVGRQLQNWSGVIYTKLSGYLVNLAAGLFSYAPGLARALQPLQERWGESALRAVMRLWQWEADAKRHPRTWCERQWHQRQWEAGLDEVVALIGLEPLAQVWAEVTQVLERVWRGSMLAECVNSLLRPRLQGRKHTDQGCLELFRFLHNVHPFHRGKRAGHSPAQLVGLEVPEDPLTLLNLVSKVSI